MTDCGQRRRDRLPLLSTEVLRSNKQNGGPGGKPDDKTKGEHATWPKERNFLHFHCCCNHNFHLWGYLAGV